MFPIWDAAIFLVSSFGKYLLKRSVTVFFLSILLSRALTEKLWAKLPLSTGETAMHSSELLKEEALGSIGSHELAILDI